MRPQADFIDIRRALSARRVHKFGPMPPSTPEGKALWLKQMDECAQDLGLPNVYRTHPYRTKPTAPREAAE